MQIIIEGLRSTDQDWLKAQQTPAEALPELSEEQKRTARSLGGGEEAYARSIYAGELSQPVWSEKARRLARILESFMTARVPGAEVLRVILRTARGMFDVLAKANGTEFSFQVREDVVDDLTEGGDAEALNRLQRIVEFALFAVPEKVRAS